MSERLTKEELGHIAEHFQINEAIRDGRPLEDSDAVLVEHLFDHIAALEEQIDQLQARLEHKKEYTKRLNDKIRELLRALRGEEEE